MFDLPSGYSKTRPCFFLLGCYALTACGGGGSSGPGTPTPDPIVIPGVSWVVPSMREDGSTLNPGDIDSYHVYYGTVSGDYQHVIEVTDPADIVADLDGLAVGTYFVVATTIDTQGRESLYSNEITLVIE